MLCTVGIPTGLDRVMQQAIAQVIGPLFEPHCSTHSAVRKWHLKRCKMHTARVCATAQTAT